MTVLVMSVMSLVVWLSNGYFFTMLALGAREFRRRGVSMSDAAALRYGDPHQGAPMTCISTS